MNGGKIEIVEEMPVFRRFDELAVAIEKAPRGFGPDFRWLRMPALRSPESVCANMTEGFYSQYDTEYLQALHRRRREGRETLLHLRYAGDTGSLPGQLLSDLQGKGEDALRQLAAVIASIKRKIGERGKTKPGAIVVKEDKMGYRPSTHEISHQPLPVNHFP